jgi:hypothetical protein
MAIYGDGKHDSGNEVNLDRIGGKYAVNAREISLDKVGIKLRAGTTSKGDTVVELIEGFEREEQFQGESEETAYNNALDALESLILAHASNGIDVASEAYQTGVQTALDACANNL